MKTILIRSLFNKYPKKLNLFFSGWGMDETPFQWFENREYDTLFIYDYSSINADFSILEQYDNYSLTAWSMGVWAAEQVNLPELSECIALNGTRTPISDTEGIPLSIFNGTLETLSEESLVKFYRRMCGRENLSSFLDHRPKRTLESLREELEHVGIISQQQNGCSPFPKKWNKAVIGLKDLIFPPANMRAHWLKQTLVEEQEVNHLFWNYTNEK